MENEMKKSGIYRIKNIITSECYVGSSINIERRWKRHQRDFKANRHDNRFMQRAYNKYGVDAFVYNVLDYCDNILEREQMFIDTGTFSYNIAKDATAPMTGKIQSDETKLKISKANKGFKHSDEAKAKISEAAKGNMRNKGRKASEETKAKISEAAKGRIFSDETKAKMSAAGKGRKQSAEHIANVIAAKKAAAAIKAHHLRKGKIGIPEQLGPDEV